MSSREYFKEIAGEWDEMRRSFFSDELREKAISFANPVPDSLAADIGAGTGFMTEGLLQKEIRTIVIDQSSEMLEELKKKFNYCTLINCRVGESENLPVEDNTVDYVFANMYLHHVPSPGKAIQEMVRILKPQGKLIITDLDAHNYRFLVEEQHDRWMGFQRNDVKKWFNAAGLEDVQVNCMNENCYSESCAKNTKASINIFMASGIKKLL